MQLKARVALVTGAARGIGAAVCEGAAVVINDHRRLELAEQVAAEIKAAGGRATAVQGDVSQAGDARAMVATAHDAFGLMTSWSPTRRSIRGLWHTIVEDDDTAELTLALQPTRAAGLSNRGVRPREHKRGRGTG